MDSNTVKVIIIVIIQVTRCWDFCSYCIWCVLPYSVLVNWLSQCSSNRQFHTSSIIINGKQSSEFNGKQLTNLSQKDAKQMHVLSINWGRSLLKVIHVYWTYKKEYKGFFSDLWCGFRYWWCDVHRLCVLRFEKWVQMCCMLVTWLWSVLLLTIYPFIVSSSHLKELQLEKQTINHNSTEP